MSQRKFSPQLLVSIILAVFFGIALYLRVYLPYDQVFVGDWIKFTGVDAYYHMRLVDNLVYNFPHRISFDPYVFYPHGGSWSSMPFFDWLLSGIILLISWGSPTQHTVDVVGVYFPAVLGALTVIPVYFIGKELFNRWAGVISAGLIALLPGEFLGRSILGFTDHHVAETLFSTIAILFLILAIKSARQIQLTFNQLKCRDWAAITKPLLYSLLAGSFLGIYILTWIGGLLFVFIIFVYFIIQFTIDHLRGRSTDYLCLIGVTTFLISLLMFLPVSREIVCLASLIIALLSLLVLSGISRLLASKKIKPAYYPLILIGLSLAGLALLCVINPSLLKSMLGEFRIFNPGGFVLTVLEVRPLLFSGGNFSLSVAWENFTTGFFLSFMSLGILIYLIIKRGEADKTLFIVWSLVILAATLGQRRFGYYFAVNVALLTGYLSWRILEFAGIRKLAAEPAETLKAAKRKKGKPKKAKKGTSLTTSHINVALAAIVLFFLIFFPNIKPAIATAKAARFAPSDAWCESLSWLKENTPEPFGSPDFYYELYEPPPPGETYKYPESAYGVMAWWDYGHWITRIAHRQPNHDPGTSWSPEVARCFIAQDEASSFEIINKLGSRYIIIDGATATTKFHAVATFADRSEEEFCDVYYQRQEGRLVPVQLFYPEYYRSLVVRLYNFDGDKVTPGNCTVISYQEKVSREGVRYKEISSLRSFATYEEVVAYTSKQKSGNYKIVSPNPFISPVPLEGLKHYKLIHSSENCIMEPNVGMISEVKIFEYIGD